LEEEIEGVITLSELQLKPSYIQKIKGQKAEKKLQEESRTVVKTISMEELAMEMDDHQETAVFTIQKSDFDFLDQTEELPGFDSLTEKREYKRKKALMKRTTRIYAPKTKENLNNTFRSSVTRRRLQLYNQQINRPMVQRNLSKCPHCAADQPEAQAQYCFFCGKGLLE
ncbi:hypothetical protein KAR91_19105, partial [Candidatus Pacearchaeota archaeon]|nr:hypothetical protein [Candidatus Pacearchaeota archaeon]